MTARRDKSESPLSLRRITEAFAQMLGRPATAAKTDATPTALPAGDPCPLNPRSIVEAILFVGRPDAGGFTAEELARTMRDVTPSEVNLAVDELNRAYEVDGAPFAIRASATGYRLGLRAEYSRLGSSLNRRVRESKLSPQVLEVLAVVAYRQPVMAAEIDALRNGRSGNALAQLVRRGLLRLERSADSTRQNCYATTDRFLRLFGLADVGQLPKAEELDLPIPLTD
jgi:segregation and condensation protein B